MEQIVRKQASKPDLYRLSSGFIDGSGKRAMKLSDEAVAAFAQVIGNDAQAIAKRKGIPDARQTYGCSALTSACAAPVPVTTPDSSRSRGRVASSRKPNPSMTSRADIGEQKTVLIVDDHPPLRQVMREFLQRVFPECSFREATDGAAALEACHAYRPQLVLMDIGLPDANGIELTARLGTLYPGIPVIVVSHKSGEVYVQQALAAGARAYVGKDRIVTSLVPAVAAAIGISPARVTGASW